jgi:hypothetical protein
MLTPPIRGEHTVQHARRVWLFNVNRRFGGTCHLHLQGRSLSQERNQRTESSLVAASFMLISCLAYSSTLKMEATRSSETLTGSQWTTRHYISGDRTLQKNKEAYEITLLSVYRLDPIFNEIRYVYLVTWVHLNGVLHKSLPSVYVSPSYRCQATAR